MENLRGSLARGARRAAGQAAGRKFARMSAPVLRACSACAGEYEDPDRTAPADDEAVDEATEDLDDGAEFDPGRGASGESRADGAKEPPDEE